MKKDTINLEEAKKNKDYIRMETYKRLFLLNYLNVIKRQIINKSNNCIDSNFYNVLKQYRDYFQKKQDSKIMFLIKKFFRKREEIKTINKKFINDFIKTCDEILNNSKLVMNYNVEDISIKKKNLDIIFLDCISDINSSFVDDQLSIGKVDENIRDFLKTEWDQINNHLIDYFTYDEQIKRYITDLLDYDLKKIDSLLQNHETNNIVQADNVAQIPVVEQNNTSDLEQKRIQLINQNSREIKNFQEDNQSINQEA